MDHALWGGLAGLGSASAAGVTGIVVKAAGLKMSPQASNAARCSVAAVLFVPIMLLFEGIPPWHAMAALWLVMSVIFAIVIGDTSLFTAISIIGASRAVPIAQAYPVFAVMLAAAFLGEPVTALKIAGGVTAVGGTALISLRATPGVTSGEASSAAHWHGVALAVVAAASWSIGLIAMRQAMHSFDIWQTSAMRMVVAAMLLWPLAMRRHSHIGRFSTVPASTAVLAIVMGLLLFASTALLVASVALVGAGSAAIFSSMAPLVTVPLGRVVFGEAVTPRVLLGVILVIAGALLCVAA